MHEMLVYKPINSVNLYCVDKACTICSYLLMLKKQPQILQYCMNLQSNK